jgi:hypothetical protein
MGMKTEHEEQREFVHVGSSDISRRSHICHPNGGQRSRTTGAKLKAEGVSAGVPDLYIPAWRCWVEMKREKGGKVSAGAERLADIFESIGDTVIVGHGCEDAQNKIKLLCK